MSANHTLAIELVSDRYALVNATSGFTWPEALKDTLPNDDSQSLTIKIANQTSSDYYYYSDTTQYNYAKHCKDSLFYPPSRVYDCAAIAVSAILVQEGGYKTDPGNIQKANQSLEFGDLDSFDGFGIIRQILECTRSSCQGPTTEHGRLLEDQFGPCGEDIKDLPESFSKVEDLSKILSPLESLCAQITREPEPDISGPGITMAYIMQIALGAWFMLFSILMPHHPKYSFAVKIAKAVRRLKKRGHRQGASREGRTEAWMERLRASRFSVALFSSLVEFQEAQVFFTLAVQLASVSMMVFNDSLGAVRIDWRAAKLFQAGNTLVVLLVQGELQRRKMHWWYTYLLTLIVCVFCLTITQLGTETEYPGFKELPGCGKSTASILETCRSGTYSSEGFQTDAMAGYSTFYFTTVLVGISFMSFDQIARIRRLHDWVAQRVESWREKSRVLKWMFKTASIFWSLLWFLMNIFLAYLLFGTTHIILHKVGGTLRKKDKWTFGQIVAVLLWAPVVFKYFYLNIFGVKRGVGNRIDNHYYKVVKKGQDQSAPEPSQQSTDGIPLTSTGYNNVPNNEDGREYGGLEDPRTPKWGRQYSVSSRDGASSVGITEPQSFPWSNSR